MEHLGASEPRPNFPVLGAHPEALSPLVGTDIQLRSEAHRPHLPSIPAPVSRDGVEAAVEVKVADQKAFNLNVVMVALNGGSKLLSAALVQHFICLDVDSPGMQTRSHGAV